MLPDTLSLIATELNRHSITWAVGASMMLNHYGLEDQPRDIDLLIDLNDIDRALSVLDQLGHREADSPKGSYTTTHFHEYIVNGTDVDVMAGFGIRHKAGIFTYEFNENAIVSHMVINDSQVPLTSLEDWYVLYQIMSGREARVSAIEAYLTSAGMKHPEKLTATLDWDIPDDIKNRVRQLLIKSSLFG